MRKFTPKSSDLRTYYLPGGQTDAEVFVERNIDISSIYEAIFFIYSNFETKMADFLLFTYHCTCVASKGREVKSSRGYEVTHAHSGYSVRRKIFY